jgi:hypothetical protein
MKRILSPIAIGKPSCVCTDQSIADTLSDVEKNLNIKEIFMKNKFMRVEEVAAELGVSASYASKVIRRLNDELKAKGFVTIAGRINRQYFNERVYGLRKEGDIIVPRCVLDYQLCFRISTVATSWQQKIG